MNALARIAALLLLLAPAACPKQPPKPPEPCGSCPEYVPPGPDYCKGGTIVPGKVDACGCQGHPTCQMPGEEE